MDVPKHCKKWNTTHKTNKHIKGYHPRAKVVGAEGGQPQVQQGAASRDTQTQQSSVTAKLGSSGETENLVFICKILQGTSAAAQVLQKGAEQIERLGLAL